MRRTLRAVVLFVLLLGFWQALSARLDPLFLTLGVLSAALVTWSSLWLIEQIFGERDDTPRVSLVWLLAYGAWLLPRIVHSGIWVALVVLDPKRPPRPGVVHFRTGLQSPAARTLLATSITLVPGTITLNVYGSEFIVHAFTPANMSDLASADTQARIARIFGVPADEPPVLRWEPVHDALPEDPP
jgi:multicomponent Na+:H+ antiporter subunit E